MKESTEDKHINTRFVAINVLVNLERKMGKQKIYEKNILFESKHMNILQLIFDVHEKLYKEFYIKVE